MKKVVTIDLSVKEVSITPRSGNCLAVKLEDVEISEIISEVGVNDILENMDIDEIIDFVNENQ
jgi:hypothetical protein